MLRMGVPYGKEPDSLILHTNTYTHTHMLDGSRTIIVNELAVIPTNINCHSLVWNRPCVATHRVDSVLWIDFSVCEERLS
jgi:hypothetical protein